MSLNSGSKLFDLHLLDNDIINIVDNGILALDMDYKIFVCNRKIEEIWGLERVKILGKNIYDLFPDAPEEVRHIEKTIATGVERRGMLTPYLWGGYDYVLVVDTYNLYKEGIRTGALAVVSDVTKIKQMERNLMRTEQINAVGQLASGIAHEIRNPMTTIRGFTQLLYNNPDFLTYKDQIELMLLEIQRVEQVITQFLHLSKPSISLERSDCNLNQIIRETCELMRGQASLHNVEFHLELDLTMPLIKADALQLRQVFMNLFKNAFEAIILNGYIHVRTSFDEAQQSVAIVVEDNGCGIPPEILVQLGDPFITTKPDGTGIGLLGCYNIIESHNGKIDVKSEVDNGTQFTVTLPLNK